MKRVLITGAQGMLGQDLARVFHDAELHLLDRKELDITHQEDVEKVIAELKPDVVLNAAAYNLVDLAEQDSGFAIAKAVNGDGPANLARACARYGIPFIHFSTDYVFSGDTPEGYAEDDLPRPRSRYAQTKRMGEEGVIAAGGAYYIVRTCRLFGRPGVGESSKQSFVDLMLHLARTKSELSVVHEEVASPTYTPDLAQATRQLIEGGYAPGVYHITNSGSCTWYEFAQEIFAQKQILIPVHPVPASQFPRPAHRPAYSVLLNTKLLPLRHWKEALRDYLTQG
ncbi:MAG: dTDP-4-dehydrorhamnose reductase [Candidatus Kerfeldbacteria bacterium]|nr:dTDP-4-dehydrorhamnose reductase [Candidatus Kerfeldbacteria bacterium]